MIVTPVSISTVSFIKNRHVEKNLVNTPHSCVLANDTTFYRENFPHCHSIDMQYHNLSLLVSCMLFFMKWHNYLQNEDKNLHSTRHYVSLNMFQVSCFLKRDPICNKKLFEEILGKTESVYLS